MTAKWDLTPISLGFRAIIIISIAHGDITPTRITVNTIARSSQAEDASRPSRLTRFMGAFDATSKLVVVQNDWSPGHTDKPQHRGLLAFFLVNSNIRRCHFTQNCASNLVSLSNMNSVVGSAG